MYLVFSVELILHYQHFNRQRHSSIITGIQWAKALFYLMLSTMNLSLFDTDRFKSLSLIVAKLQYSQRNLKHSEAKTWITSTLGSTSRYDSSLGFCFCSLSDVFICWVSKKNLGNPCFRFTILPIFCWNNTLQKRCKCFRFCRYAFSELFKVWNTSVSVIKVFSFLFLNFLCIFSSV